MKHYEVGQKLIGKTIMVIANKGLDKTTTKEIVRNTDINEAYIYRFFEDKEDLLSKTFDKLDEELVNTATRYIEVMYMRNLDYEMRCRVFFNGVWRFLLSNKEKCLAFIRYYYSPYFHKHSVDSHKNRYKELVEKFCEAFKSESNVWMIINHILNVMLDFAVKIFDGELSDNDDTTEHIFRLVYNSVNQYFK